MNNHHQKPTVYSTASSSYLADIIASKLSAPRGNIIRKEFGDGEQYYRIDCQSRTELVGKDVIYVATTASDADFLELVRVGHAFAGYGTRRRIFFIPFLGYSTMERAVLPGEVVTTKVNCCLLSSIPNTGWGNTFVLVDVHQAGIVHYFEGPATRVELYAEPILLKGIEALGLVHDNMMFASADLGRPKWVESFAKNFNTEMAFIRKSRDFEKIEVIDVVGDVKGKNVIIYDDMTRSGSTLVNAADAYLARGALTVYAVLSHLALNSEAVVALLEKSRIFKIICTNTHPMTNHKLVRNSSKFVILDISPIFLSFYQDHDGTILNEC